MARELSVVWQKVLTALWRERTTKTEIARSLYLPEEEIENLLFGLAGGPPDAPDASVKPPLRLIS
jgi:hypothetical protein